jgi:hypothetical protein
MKKEKRGEKEKTHLALPRSLFLSLFFPHPSHSPSPPVNAKQADPVHGGQLGDQAQDEGERVQGQGLLCGRVGVREKKTCALSSPSLSIHPPPSLSSPLLSFSLHSLTCRSHAVPWLASRNVATGRTVRNLRVPVFWTPSSSCGSKERRERESV